LWGFKKRYRFLTVFFRVYLPVWHRVKTGRYLPCRTIILAGMIKAIGKHIRFLRQQNDWTQEDVAKRLGISVPAYCKIETGHTDPRLSRLVSIADALGVTLPELFPVGDGKSDTGRGELEQATRALAERELQINLLQLKIIHLYEEMLGQEK
jgi:transcriptional regulator with XRE-family HTH domain